MTLSSVIIENTGHDEYDSARTQTERDRDEGGNKKSHRNTK
jgi:hypothetical protein